MDTDDIHCLMIGASGIGKTAFFLYPNLEYACACGMSFLALDTKGDLARNYGAIASRCYGYQVAVIDLRNPTRSDGYNLLTLINHYMDICREDSENLAARVKAEKYAKILAKTIVNPDGDASQYGQNAFFYDAAEGLLTAVILLLAEYLPPDKKTGTEQRHIVSVFKLVQDLLAPSRSAKGKNGFQVLILSDDVEAENEIRDELSRSGAIPTTYSEVLELTGSEVVPYATNVNIEFNTVHSDIIVGGKTIEIMRIYATQNGAVICFTKEMQTAMIPQI